MFSKVRLTYFCVIDDKSSLKLKFIVKNFKNKKNKECIPIKVPVIKSYNTPDKIINILDAS